MTKQAIVDAKAFAETLEQVSKALKNMPLSVLSEVFVHCDGNRCTMIATDLDTWLKKEIPASGEEFSFVFCRTKDVAKACRHFEGKLTMECSDTGDGPNRSLSLRLTSGKRSGEFKILSAEDYPKWPSFEAETSFALNAADLARRISRVRYAAAKQASSTKPSVSSIQCIGNRVFALDGYRMACDVADGFTFPKAFMAMEDTLSHLKLFGAQMITVKLGKGCGEFTDNSATLGFHVTGGDFFNVDGAVPQSFKEQFQVSTKEFLRELKYLKEFTSRESKPYVRFLGGNLFMPVTSGKYAAGVEIVGTNDIMFAFDLHKMMDAVQQFKDEPRVTVKVNSAVAPIILSAEGRSDFALVCTVKLSERLMAA